MTSADPQLVSAMFRALRLAEAGTAAYCKIDASTPDGIAGLVLVAMPDHVWRQYVDPTLRGAMVDMERIRDGGA